MQSLSETISKWLAYEGVIPNSDTNLYSYAIHSLLFGLAPIGVCALWGVFFDCMLESAVMLVPFIVIRKFSGGFHFQTQGLCLVVSSIMLGGAVIALNCIRQTQIQWPLSVIVVISVISIALQSPIDSPARPLSPKERKVFRGVAISIALFTSCLYMILTYCGQWRWAVPIGIGMIIPAFLQLPCALKNIKCKLHLKKTGGC